MTCEYGSHVIMPLLNKDGLYCKTDAAEAVFLQDKQNFLPLAMGFQPDLTIKDKVLKGMINLGGNFGKTLYTFPLGNNVLFKY